MKSILDKQKNTIKTQLKGKSRKKIMAAFIPLFLALVAGCGSSSNSSDIIPTEIDIKPTLDETLNAYLNTNIPDDSPGIAILVIQDDVVIYSGTKGMANKMLDKPVTTDTGFRIASISKVFTALAIMKLYESQLLDLTDSILSYLPELPPSWGHITLHHLLTHQAGIPRYEDHANALSWIDGQTNDDVLNFYTLHSELSFVAGTDAQYSNSAYHLLAEIISRVSGQTFEDYMMDSFFIPLEMNHSYVADETTIPRDNDALNFAEFSTFAGNNNFTNGANGVVSSINDLEIFMSKLLSYQIVKEQTLELMLQHHTKSLPVLGGADYGYGWILDTSETDAFSHTGGHDGFRTWLLINRDQNLKLVILGNGGDLTGDHSFIAELIRPFLQ